MTQPIRLESRAAGRNQHVAGFTIIELMIALAIGLVISGAVLYVYVGVIGTSNAHRAMARLQENVRFTYELFSREIRMAGSDACGAASVANVVVGSNWYSSFATGALTGYEATTSGSPATGLPADVTSALADRDAITILHADNSASLAITGHNPSSAQIDLSASSDLQKGEILVACSADGTHAAIFQMTGPNSADPSHVVHSTGVAGVSPGNCSKKLGLPIPSPCDASTPASQGTDYTFGNGSRLMRLSGMTYFIRNNPNGIPSLYHQKLGVSGGTAATAAEELVEGVQDMQLTYGVDTDVSNDSAQKGMRVDQYVAANAVTDWTRVLAVKVSLLFQTAEDNVAKGPQTYTYNGSTVTASDRRIRKTATQVVRLRNR